MATKNYRTIRNLNIYAYEVDTDDIFAALKEEYEEEEITLDMVYDISDTYYEDFRREIDPIIEKLNDQNIFHKITLEAGYYEGIQLVIEAEHELDKYDDYDDEDCEYYFDMCRDDAYKAFYKEIETIREELNKVACDLGMIQYVHSATDSSGYGYYKRVA